MFVLIRLNWTETKQMNQQGLQKREAIVWFESFPFRLHGSGFRSISSSFSVSLGRLASDHPSLCQPKSQRATSSSSVCNFTSSSPDRPSVSRSLKTSRGLQESQPGFLKGGPDGRIDWVRTGPEGLGCIDCRNQAVIRSERLCCGGRSTRRDGNSQMSIRWGLDVNLRFRGNDEEALRFTIHYFRQF